jgi:hypothetical protein
MSPTPDRPGTKLPGGTMKLRRAVLALTTLLVALLATVVPTSAQALGQRTQSWDNGSFKASMTINFLSKHTFSIQGWLSDVKCDGRGVYFDDLQEQHRTASGTWAFGPSWYVGWKDDNGCNNGRTSRALTRYTAGDKLVGYVRVTICSRNGAANYDTQYCYSRVWNNPYIDG